MTRDEFLRRKLWSTRRTLEEFANVDSVDQVGIVNIDREVTTLSLLLEIMGEEPLPEDIAVIRELKRKIEKGYV